MITEGQWKRWKDNSTTDDRLNTYVLSDIRQMLGEIERLRTDAARYQYLRSRPDDTIGNGGVFAGTTPPTGSGGSILTEEDLDRAIDAALSQQNHAGGK